MEPTISSEYSFLVPRVYLAIDLKSYYASVEAVARGLDPLKVNLLVADETRSDNTICLAVSPSLKALGVPGRPRLFEAKQAIRKAEIERRIKVDYIIAPPRMAGYLRMSALIYRIYLKYLAPESIHVYSIDECFFDATGYLHLYEDKDSRQCRASLPEHQMALAHRMTIAMIRDVLRTTGITATAGIGTNLYLAKIAMDIVAKRQEADADGVRIAHLDENSFKELLWDHRPLTDFWQIGPGTAGKLAKYGIWTMGDIARQSLVDEDFFYRLFGINGELIIDHAWGIETVLMSDIKAYRPSANSLSSGQVLPRPYKFQEARVVFGEMTDLLAAELAEKNLTTKYLSFHVGFDHESIEQGLYSGPVYRDFYGRLVPKHTVGTVRLRDRTSSCRMIMDAVLRAFDEKVDHRLLIRRLGIAANETKPDDGQYQIDMFADYETLDKEKRLQAAMLQIRKKYGKNAVLKGINFMEGGTARERNLQIGGHRAF
ncbi:MAG: DNA methylase [Abditibacteriota bacterium]|nr:DNA methylase [Abditibacteriota bacterium]